MKCKSFSHDHKGNHTNGAKTQLKYHSHLERENAGDFVQSFNMNVTSELEKKQGKGK